MFGLPKVAVHVIAAALLLAGGFFALSRYGARKYDEGRRQAEIAHTDSVRKEMTRVIDSVHAAMSPVLESMVRENDSLKAERRSLRLAAGQAVMRAKHLDSLYQSVKAQIDVSPPEVRDLIDQYRASNDSLSEKVKLLIAENLRADTEREEALLEAAKWKSLQELTRSTLDTAEKEIDQLKKQKKPPRCGWKCGFVAGTLTLGAIIASVLIVAR